MQRHLDEFSERKAARSETAGREQQPYPERDYNAEIDAELRNAEDFERRSEDACNRIDERLAGGLLTLEQAEWSHERLTHYELERREHLERLRTALDRAHAPGAERDAGEA